jgi:hypothetical protein
MKECTFSFVLPEILQIRRQTGGKALHSFLTCTERLAARFALGSSRKAAATSAAQPLIFLQQA